MDGVQWRRPCGQHPDEPSRVECGGDAQQGRAADAVPREREIDLQREFARDCRLLGIVPVRPAVGL